MEQAVVGLVESVAEIDGAFLRDGEDGTVVGEIALDLPVAAVIGIGFGGGTEINVGGTDPDVGGAIILDSLADGKIGDEDHRAPRGRAIRGRCIGKWLGVVAGKPVAIEENNLAGLGVRVLNGRIGGSGVGRTDYRTGEGQS